MEHYQEVMVALSDSVMKICRKLPLAEKNDDVISDLQENLAISETVHPRQKLVWNAIRKSLSLTQNPS